MNRFRRAVLGDSRRRDLELARAAARLEQEALRAEDPRFLAAMQQAASSPNMLLGHSAQGTSTRLALTALDGAHGHITGATGSGKSFVVAALLSQLLGRMCRGEPIAAVVFVMQGFLGDFTLGALGAELQRQPATARSTMLERLSVFRLFRGPSLTPWQLLAPEPSVSPMVQAAAYAEVIEQVLGARVGARQELTLTFLLALAIMRGKTLLELRALLFRPEALVAEARLVPIEEVRLYFRERFLRESRASLDGLRSRFDLLLRDEALKATLSGPQRFDFARCFRPGALTVIDCGGASLAFEGARTIAALLLLSLAFRVFDPRRSREAQVLLIGDELQQALTPTTVRVVERLVTTARAHRVGLFTIHQALAQLPPELAEILATNARYRFLFRASRDEARRQLESLPEVRGRDGQGATTEARIELATRLPPQHFVFTDRAASWSPVILEAPRFTPTRLETLPPDLRRAVERGALGVGRETLVGQAQAQEDAAFRSLTTASAASFTPDVTPRRRNR